MPASASSHRRNVGGAERRREDLKSLLVAVFVEVIFEARLRTELKID